MLVISSREFRANTGRYLDMVAKGMDVILKSRSLGSFRLTPVKESDVVMSEKDFYVQVVDQISQHHLLKRLFLIHCIYLPPLSKIRCDMCVDLSLGFLFCSIDLYFCLCASTILS